jgi:hypothetical protein
MHAPGEAWEEDETVVRMLAHKAKLNGYAVEPEQISSSGGFQINVHLDEFEKP